MSPENANPLIVAIILLPGVLCCLMLIAGALREWYKLKGEEP